MKNLYVLLLVLLALVSCKKEKSEFDELEKKKNEDCNCGLKEAFPNIKGEVITFGKGDNSISIVKKGEHYIMGGDIILSAAQVEKMRQYYENGGTKVDGAVRTDFFSLWPNKTVYYAIDPALTDTLRVSMAIAEFRALTPLKFVRRNNNETNYIYFTPSADFCSSQYGMVGGQQKIYLAPTCTYGTTIHEIGHAVGLYHEQSREDRDDYLQINWANIKPGMESNFEKYSIWNNGTDVGPFDFQSIMLYDMRDFSKNGQKVMTMKNGYDYYAQNLGLSQGDVDGINYLYGNNPSALPFAKIEYDNFGGNYFPNISQEDSADVYIAFYNLASQSRIVPSSSITFKYRDVTNISTYFASGDQPHTDYTVNNINGLNRIFIGRYSIRRVDFNMEDPQWGIYDQTTVRNFTLIPGTGYYHSVRQPTVFN